VSTLANGETLGEGDSFELREIAIPIKHLEDAMDQCIYVHDKWPLSSYFNIVFQ
jgi:hypothetical protein